ncbi:Retrotransposon-derived protein PEG10 [Ceratobasidium theobromae]|uniref:Retrotransposon-derived protein PEG10 n=1 Tax=Ceratobasidium theobromae TaxID=1582974 RepID=A0A5N5Q8P7_9AGAM|nr:Retrotransposon-derived protein PEG10 [Ceratobasidium theobromae]
MAKLESKIEQNLNERERDYNSRLEGIRMHIDIHLDDTQIPRHKETMRKVDDIEKELGPPATSTPIGNPYNLRATQDRSPVRPKDTLQQRTLQPQYDNLDEEERGRPREPIMKKPDAYDGKRGLSARTFMTQMETYFLTRTVMMGEIEKIYAVLTNMGNNPSAATWTQPLLEQRNKGVEHPYLQTWEAFRMAFLLNFDDPTFQLKVSNELMAITQTSSVAEYASRFRALSAQVSWNDETLTAGFKRGLKNHICTELTKATLFDNGKRTFEEWVTVAITLDNVLYARTDQTGPC